jgi:hypothetical protein
MEICTIGYTKKSLRDFVSRLKQNNVKKVIEFPSSYYNIFKKSVLGV